MNYNSINDMYKSFNNLLYDISNKYVIPEIKIRKGHNGPYNDPETLVRNYSHWINILSYLYKLNNDDAYKRKIYELVEYIISKDGRPHGFSFHHRNGTKDFCNGLVGQAWTFEALTNATLVLNDLKYVEIGEDVFFQHMFNEEYYLWNSLEIDGKVLSIDTTFNHQLWFAACSLSLNGKRKKNIKEKVLKFLDSLGSNLTVFENGLIYHPILTEIKDKYPIIPRIKKIKKFLRKHCIFLNKEKNMSYSITDKMIYKSVGYHHFNMYAFAMLKEQLPDLKMWESKIFNKMVDYMLSPEFKKELEDNIYSFPYNAPGFEIPYAACILTNLDNSNLVKIAKYWIKLQLDQCYDFRSKMMSHNTTDADTHTARVYELTRFFSFIKGIKLV